MEELLVLFPQFCYHRGGCETDGKGILLLRKMAVLSFSVFDTLQLGLFGSLSHR